MKTKCYACGESIYKSDCQEAWVTITRSSYWLNDVRIKSTKKVLHLSCASFETLNPQKIMQVVRA